MNKGLIAGLIVVVLVGGFFLLRDGQTPTSQDTIMEEESESVSDSLVEEDKAGQIVVEGSEYKFSPVSLLATQGETVTILFKNVGTMPHDFTIDEFGVATSILSPGEEEEVTFVPGQTGTFSYYCSVGNHRALGMEGSLEVQ